MAGIEIPESEEDFQRMLNELPEGQREGFRSLFETLRPWEKLHPELQAHVYEDENGRMHLKHPLIFDVFYAPGTRDGHLNGLFQQKKEAIEEYRAEGNWRGIVWMYERAYRLDALLDVASSIDDDCEFWDLVGGIWTDSENIHQNYYEWRELLESLRPCRNSMMDEEEQQALAAMPDTLTIYRGFNHDSYDGFSWTLEYERAEWFAKRFESIRGPAKVAIGKVSKDDVIAYFNGRGEEEIVVLPENVNEIEIKEV